VSVLKKLKEKFFKSPIPTDITPSEVQHLMEAYGCVVKPGGKHPMCIIHKKSGTLIPIPIHGKHVQDVYIKQLKKLILQIEEDSDELRL